MTELNKEQGLLREAAADFAAREAGVARMRRLMDVNPSFERAMWKRMAELGWMRLFIPEAHQGLGLGMADMAAVLEPLATQLFPEPLGAATMACRAIVLGDNAALQAALLPQLGSGERIAALAWQEIENHLDPRQCVATAIRTAQGWTLYGDKRFVVPGELADGFVVSAMESGKVCLFWVPADASGLQISLEKRADGSRSAALQLQDVSVDAGQRIAGPEAGLAALTRAIDEGAVLSAVEALGVLDRALDITLDYLRTRVQFGKPIGSFQALQHRAVNMHIQRELARATVQACLAVVDRYDDAAPTLASAAASRARVRCCEAALAITRECVQLHGAIGFTHDCDIGLYLKRALVLAASLGNPAAHRRRFGALLLQDSAQAPAMAVPAELPRDTDWNALEDESFRAQVRLFFEKYYPSDLRHLHHHPTWEEIRGWFRTLSDKGWMAPSWPREHGGMGLTPSKLLIFIEERERWGVARGPDHGVNLIGPLLIRHGTSEQRARYLPPMLTGEERWCQGYSEPNSGSDLASLRTTAVLEGDEFVINGQKIWTSYGAGATHMFMLARTGTDARKQEGISFLLLDLKTPGITVRTIRNLAGHRHFCEVFFDGARTHVSNLVGELNRGWSVAKALLGFERLFSGSPKRPQQALSRLMALAKSRNLLSDPVFLDRLTRLRLDVDDHAALYEVFAEQVRRGEPLGPDVSMLKVWGTETFQRLSELLVEAAGNCGAIEGNIAFGDEDINVLGQFYDTFPSTIASGTNEIQRNILARNVLKLPG
jgi:alkylation response protein AidB-like acyl-CoA dehydrogenase